MAANVVQRQPGDERRHHLPLELHYELILFASHGTLASLASFSASPNATLLRPLTKGIIFLANRKLAAIRDKIGQRQRQLMSQFLGGRPPSYIPGYWGELLFIGNISTCEIYGNTLPNANIVLITKKAISIYTSVEFESGQTTFQYNNDISKMESQLVSTDAVRRRIRLWKIGSDPSKDCPFISIDFLWQADFEEAKETLKAEIWPFDPPVYRQQSRGIRQKILAFLQDPEWMELILLVFFFVLLLTISLLVVVPKMLGPRITPVPSGVAATSLQTVPILHNPTMMEAPEFGTKSAAAFPDSNDLMTCPIFPFPPQLLVFHSPLPLEGENGPHGSPDKSSKSKADQNEQEKNVEVSIETEEKGGGQDGKGGIGQKPPVFY